MELGNKKWSQISVPRNRKTLTIGTVGENES